MDVAAFEPKLTETMKARIFDEALKGAKTSALAKEYGVSVQSVGRHARKEKWVSGCRHERRRRAESRDCLLEMTRALMRGAKRAAEEAEKGEACTKELKELAGILQTLAGLEKELGGGTAAQTVQVLMGEGVRELSE